MILREFGSYVDIDSSKVLGLKEYVQDAWSNRYNLYDDNIFATSLNDNKQQFLNFNGSQVKARNYVGFINYDGIDITIIPKIFSNVVPEDNINQYLITNLLYWLGRSKKIKFPIINSQIDLSDNTSFLEIMLSIFSKYTYNLIYIKPYNCYEEVEEELAFLKGRLSTNKYLKENISTGRWNKFNTVHEPFSYNNKFNQIIKYVSKKLASVTKVKETKDYLQKITFILDDIDDCLCSEHDCSKVKLNRLQEDYVLVLSLCEFFLRNTSLSKSMENDKLDFCFLIPMEILYEDFIFNIINDELKSEFKQAIAQKSNLFLAEAYVDDIYSGKVFNLKQDIFIKKLDDEILIIDTKYKQLNFEYGNKFGISQSDMYQMCSYAIRGGYNNLILLYPESLKVDKKIKYTIKDTFSKNDITINIIQVPFAIDFNEFIYNNSEDLFKENDYKIIESLKRNVFLVNNI